MKQKLPRLLFAVFFSILGLFVPVQNIWAQSAPYYDVIGNLSVDEEVIQANLQHLTPYTTELSVPPGPAEDHLGFNLGFLIQASVEERIVVLDSIRMTGCSFSLYHLNVVTGEETPVLLINGNPAINTEVSVFASEAVESSRPSVFLTAAGTGPYNGPVISEDNTSIINTTVQNVGALFATRQKLTWGSLPDFTHPTLNQGYVVRWNIRFIPTFQGIEYPEVTLNGDRIKFVYKVVNIPFPQMVNISGNGPNGGMLVQMSGDYVEYFGLQRSIDLVNWVDWPFAGEGNGWVGPLTYDMGEGAFAENIYQWELFDRSFPDERRLSPKEFYRMVWTGRKGVGRTSSYP